MKKVGAVLATMALVVALILPISASAISGSARISGASNVVPGKTISVVLSASGKGVYGIQSNVKYSTSQLEYAGCTKLSSGGSDWSTICNNNGGEVVVVSHDNTYGAPLNKSVQIAKIYFKVKSNVPVGTKINISMNSKLTDDGSEHVHNTSNYYATVVKQKTKPSTTKSKTTRSNKDNKMTTQPVAVPGDSTTEVVKGTKATINSMSVEGFVLSPKFNPDQKEYTVWLPYETKEIKINALPVDETAKVEIKGGKNLVAGKENIVKVICTSEKGTKQIYTIKAMRAPVSGVYGTVEETSSDKTTTAIPMYITIALCVGCVVVGFILALIISLIKRRHDYGPVDDNYDEGPGVNLFDNKPSNNENSIEEATSKFKGVSFPGRKTKVEQKPVEKEQQRMYIKPTDAQQPVQQQNMNPTGVNPVQQQPTRPIQPPVRTPVQPPVAAKPVQPQMQRPVQPPVQNTQQAQQVSKPVGSQSQNSVQPPQVTRPVQPQAQQPSTPVQPTVQRPVQPQVERPVQPQFDKPVQPQVQRQVQPSVDMPVQPKTQMESSATIEVGDKMDNMKPVSSAPQTKEDKAPKKEVEKMRLPYTAAGTPQPEQQLDKPATPKPSKKLPRNPFELSADD